MINDLSDAIAALLPETLRHELRDNINVLVQSNFDKMNLVTREQFEIQEKVLRRTRARLVELEKQLATLEKQIATTSAPSHKEDE